jgi:amino acid adenylation domain-containing protein
VTLSERLASLGQDQLGALRERFRHERLGLTDFAALFGVQSARSGTPSLAQERLWFMQQLAPDSPFYNLPAGYRIRGPLDVPALRRALDLIVESQPELRTNLIDEAGRPRTVVDPSRTMPLILKDLSGLPEAEREARTREVLAQEESEPFDLARDPLIRGRLLRLAPDDHLLLVTIHHAVSDGWSLLVFIRDLVAAYEPLRAGRPAPLAPLTVQYADFGGWQRRELAGPRYDKRLDYWSSALAGAPSLLGLPTDRPRPAEQTFRGAVHRFQLPSSTVAATRRLADAENVTLFMVTLAAFQALLGRYARTEDVIVGTPDAGRRHDELERVIGFFVNTLVLRADLSGDPPFRYLVRRTRENALAAYDNAEVPFDRLVELVGARRELSHSPLVQVMFQLVTGEERHWRTGGGEPLDIDLVDLPPTVTRFDLEFYLSEQEDGEFEGWICYSTDLFDPDTIAQFVDHYLVLLSAATVDPDSRLSELPWLTAAERNQLLVRWQGVRTPAATEPVSKLIADRARERPDAVAIASGSRSYTYGELDRRADALARWLRGRGTGAGDMVAVFLPRDVDLATAWLGVLRSGAAYVPLDRDYPRERLRYLVESSGTRLVLTDGSPVDDIVPADVLAQPLAAIPEDPGPGDPAGGDPEPGDPDTAPIHDPDPASPAYVIYTSGSTGRPKGVLVPHRGLQNLCSWHIRAFEVGPADRASHTAALGFDAAAWELWPNLVVGASVHLVPDDARLAPEALLNWLDRAGITVSFLPTALAESVLAASEATGTQPGSLRVLLTGGDLLRRGRPASARYRFVNNYGPTENTVVSVWTDVLPGDGHRQPPIGVPVDNTLCYVLDGYGQPVPVGVAGELFVAGPQVALGYLHSADLTEERFVPDPFSTGPDARMYATGDLVRWRADGRLDFLGRIDDQVQVRGYRVEPGEIRSVLAKHDGVRDCAVLAHREGSEVVLSAYVVPAGDPPAETALRRHLRSRLPVYMVPSSFSFVPELPTTTHGKLDRAALLTRAARPSRARPAGSGPLAEEDRPRGPVEQAVADVVAEVLGGARLGRDDDFFGHGGNSLLATQVLARVGERLGARPGLGPFFQAPTISGIADAVTAEQRAEVRQR